MRTGIIHDETMEEYHASGALGSSKIKDYLRDPVAYKRRHIDKHPRFQQKETKAMLEGSVLHSMVEGRVLQDYCVVDDTYNKDHVSLYIEDNDKFEVVPSKYMTNGGKVSTKLECRNWQDQLISDGITIVTMDQYDNIAQTADKLMKPDGTMRKAVTQSMWSDCEFYFEQIMRNSQAKEMIENSDHEVTARMQDTETGLYVQSRYDLYQSGSLIGDVKKTKSSLEKFHYEARNYGYDVQAALYMSTFISLHPDLDGSKFEFWFVVISNQYPYQCQCMMASPTMIDEGMSKIEYALPAIKREAFASLIKEEDLLEW